MAKNPINSNKPRASVLAATLIILAAMLAIALSISLVSIQERKASIGANRSSLAYQEAESGIENVMQVMKASLVINPLATIAEIDTDGTCDGIVNLPGKYKVELKDSSGNVITDCATPASSIAKIKAVGVSGQNSRAIEVELGGSFCNWETFGSLGASTNQFHVPNAVAVDSTNNKVYVMDYVNYRVVRFDSGGGGTTFGANWQTFGSYGGGVSRFAYSTDIAVDSIHNKVYVADVGGQHITRFDSGSGGTTFGDNWQTFGSIGSGVGQWTDPDAMFVDATNNKVYVIDALVHLYRFDSGSGGTTFGGNWQTFGSYGSGVGQFMLVAGIHVDSANNKVYVSNDYGYNVLRFDSGSGGTTLGANWQTFGTGGTGTNQFGRMEDIHVDSASNKAYVVDRGNNRIVRFDSGSGGTTFGGNWQTFGSYGSGVGQFSYADGIAIDPISKKVFVTEGSNHRVDRFSWSCFN